MEISQNFVAFLEYMNFNIFSFSGGSTNGGGGEGKLDSKFSKIELIFIMMVGSSNLNKCLLAKVLQHKI